MNEILTGLLDWLEAIDPVLRTFVAGFGMLLETSILIGLVVPGDTIVIISSLGVTNTAEYLGLLIAVILGALIGESIGFALGRFFGPRLRETRLGRLIGTERWERADAYLTRRGGIAVFISRFLPVLHSLIPVTVGMSHMRYRTFMLWTVPACVIWAGLYVTVGYAAADYYREHRDALSGQLHMAGYLFVGILIAFILVVALAKKWLERREERFMDDHQAKQAEDPQQNA